MPSQDSVYKSLFSQPEVLESLLRYYGPAELSDMLDFKSLEDVGTDLLGVKGQKRQSDLIFKIRFHNQDYLYLILLLEIQGSQYQNALALRMLEYVVLIWQKLLRQDKTTKTLPTVLPILLHTGSHPFSRPTRVSELMGIYPSFLAKFQPQFEFCLVDECELVPLARDRTDPTSILMASNQARNMDDFEKAVEQIDRLASDQGLRNLASQLLRWLLKVGRKGKLDLKVDPEEISLENLKENIVMLQENIHKFRHEDFEKGVVFGINQGREEGIEKGIEKGRQEGQRETLKLVVSRMLEAGTPKDTILMATGLSLVELNELLSDLG